MQKLVWIGLLGAAGALARYGLAGAVQRATGAGFPWGTLAVNATGCFLFGVIWMLASERMLLSGETRLIVLVGFMGAFTTFSTFSFETAQLMRDAEWALALGNIALQNGLGLVAVFAGLSLGKVL